MVGYNALMAIVCLSVCPVPDPKSKMEVHSKLRIGRKPVTRMIRETVTQFRGLKVKATRPLNALSHIFGMGKSTNFKLGTHMEYDDPHHRHTRSPPT